MPYYSERLNPMGNWCAQITPDRPSEKVSDGGTVRLREIREIPSDRESLSLGELINEFLIDDIVARLTASGDTDAAQVMTKLRRK